MKKPLLHLIAEVPRRQPRIEMMIGIDLGDAWSLCCTLSEEGEVVDRGRFRTTPKGLAKLFTDVPPARVAMEAGTHSIWISEQLRELGHHVIVANVRELRSISHGDRKSDHADAEKLWTCPVYGGNMNVVQRLSPAQLLLRSPPPHEYAA
jgi:transposase